MKILHLILIALTLASCSGQVKNTETEINTQNKTTIDTTYYQIDNKIYQFDTLVNSSQFMIKTYCLNDSAIFMKSYSDQGVGISVAHNYASDIRVKTKENEFKIHITKENFKNSLSSDFFRICHMYKNDFFETENGEPIFCATLAQPDTDYQIAIYYKINPNHNIIIVKVEDQSNEGADE